MLFACAAVTAVVMLVILEGTMRFLLALGIVVVVSTVAYSQVPNQTGTSTTNTDHYQGLAYPTRGYAPPRIPLRRALKTAEAFIKKNRIDMSSCYLIEAKWMADGTKTSWQFLWAHTSEAWRFVLIAVSADGKPYRTHLM